MRDVRRVPLKITAPLDAKERAHLSMSSDGLASFIPVDIYGDNIVSISGLVAVLRKLQQLEGFGSPAPLWSIFIASRGCKDLLAVDPAGLLVPFLGGNAA